MAAVDHPRDTIDMNKRARLTRYVDRTAGWALDLVADALILLALVALGSVTVTLAFDLAKVVLSRGETDILAKVMLDVLTVFIFLEIFHSFLDFLRTKTVEIVNLADITLAIVFREVWIGLFSKELAWQGVMALALLIVAVGVVRVLVEGRILSLWRRPSPADARAPNDPGGVTSDDLG
jgi:uncharacterized membrane protein (DUF373 family)